VSAKTGNMKTLFYILLSLKTPDGFETYGQYSFGDEWQAAYDLFGQLKGSDKLPDQAVFHIDLMETIDELPVKIKAISCTLDELGWNSRLIAREIFRLKNLKEAK
jgi:hypothetical protein